MNKLLSLFIFVLCVACDPYDAALAPMPPPQTPFDMFAVASCAASVKTSVSSVVSVWFTHHMCSGVVLSSRLVATNAHCVVEQEPAYVYVDNVAYAASFFSFPPNTDLAVIMLRDELTVSPISLAETIPKPGDTLSLIGYGCSAPHTTRLYRQATVSTVTLGNSTEPVLEVAGCICHGDSGGAALNDLGKLVGLMAGTDNEGVRGWVVSTELLQSIIDEFEWKQ